MASVMTLSQVEGALKEPFVQIGLASVGVVMFVVAVFVQGSSAPEDSKKSKRAPGVVESYAKFAYNCFFKPFTAKKSRNQQDALESFYSAQATVYDATRARLLRGREDMLGLVAAQIKQRVEKGSVAGKPVWVDIGGGTGYNIEAMKHFIDVPNFFEAVYLVDLSPSLCRVAEDRFQRLGWKNVRVICQDARHFSLDEHNPRRGRRSIDEKAQPQKAEVITMSYSLSMIPEFYPVIDSISSLLHTDGVIGVADFYVQSELDYQARNYTGGEIDRHCMWISRVFWRTWFEADRVSLEAARRDYLEYRFGTILSFNARCHMVGLRIPYYVWVGCSKESAATQKKLAELNAAVTESPYISALDLHSKALISDSAAAVQSKAYESAIVNLQSSLPLPAAWYQAHHWRIYFDETLKKHRQFNDEYIYAFTWEDSRTDARLLKIQEDDVILAITSAGDNILAYACEKPKRIHAVDLNPSQNHLLELKLASFTALPYADFWKLFGEGKHPEFRKLLLEKLSPHLSSLAFQYWLRHGPKNFDPKGRGLYATGGSRHALNLIPWLFRFTGLKGEATKFLQAQTLAEQREIWHRSLRGLFLSKLLHWVIVSSKVWLWKALGVPEPQRQMIEQDHLKLEADAKVYSPATHASGEPHVQNNISGAGSGQAIWNYAVNTLDPVVETTLLSEDNHYYLLCLQGKYTQRCHPTYLSPRAHQKLSRPGAFDGLRIHTDEVSEVVERMTPSTLTIAVVMDSMDWFDPNSKSALDALRKQVTLLHRALKDGGRVMLRSAGTSPWYINVFEEHGFRCKRVCVRLPGTATDRVNMYASTWICTKGGSSAPNSPQATRRRVGSLEPLSIGEAAQN